MDLSIRDRCRMRRRLEVRMVQVLYLASSQSMRSNDGRGCLDDQWPVDRLKVGCSQSEDAREWCSRKREPEGWRAAALKRDQNESAGPPGVIPTAANVVPAAVRMSPRQSPALCRAACGGKSVTVSLEIGNCEVFRKFTVTLRWKSWTRSRIRQTSGFFPLSAA